MASNTAPKTVLLKGQPAAYEAEAAGAITPGMLLLLNSSGKVIAHNGAAAVNVPALFARELEFAGGSLEEDYASGDLVPYWHCRPGDMVYALLEMGANVAVGALLESNGAGALQAVTAGIAVVQAMEAVDATAAIKRIKVRVI